MSCLFGLFEMKKFSNIKTEARPYNNFVIQFSKFPFILDYLFGYFDLPVQLM